MTGHRTFYDISVDLMEESIPFPGDPPFSKEMLLTIEDSGICNVSKLAMSAHSGTHIDMPAHFIPEGATLDAYSIHHFILPARVVAVENAASIEAWDIEGLKNPAGEAILFKTENSVTGRCRNGAFSEDFVYISADAATACVEKKAALVGLDYITIEKPGDDAFPAHRNLLGGGILVLEGINLEAVPPGSYTLICLPLKIKGGEASPVRAILIAPPL